MVTALALSFAGGGGRIDPPMSSLSLAISSRVASDRRRLAGRARAELAVLLPGHACAAVSSRVEVCGNLQMSTRDALHEGSRMSQANGVRSTRCLSFSLHDVQQAHDGGLRFVRCCERTSFETS